MGFLCIKHFQDMDASYEIQKSLKIIDKIFKLSVEFIFYLFLATMKIINDN